jgi:hypothetical protein
MLRRAFAFVLVLTLVSAGVPTAAAAIGIKQSLGTIQGKVVDDSQKGLPNVCVQLRNVDTGQIADKTTTDKDGGFLFKDVKPGNYVVEAVNCATAAVLAVSSPLAMTAGGSITGIVLILSSAVESAPGFFSGSVAAMLIAGAGAGVVAIVVLANESSPKNPR